MPRRARLSVPVIPWHIIQRGNNRNACFYSDDDYHYYLETLIEQADTHLDTESVIENRGLSLIPYSINQHLPINRWLYSNISSCKRCSQIA